MIHTDTTSFISGIKHELKGGLGFTPFLGSGISAQSGIIMSQQFSEYLAYTVFRVLSPGLGGKRWDIRRRGWPALPDGKAINHVYIFLFTQYKEHVKHYKCTLEDTEFKGRRLVSSVNADLLDGHAQTADYLPTRDLHLKRPMVPEILRGPNFWKREERWDEARRLLQVKDEPSDLNMSRTSDQYILDMALRCLSHWTRTLEFLATVAVDMRGNLYLDEMDLSVIDSFNAHITHNKRPNLIHNMIARLARVLRTHVILTTNFDTLIEQSFRAQGEPLHTLAVSIRGGLPAFSTVRAQDCLVKLHGDILETRADSSINLPPSETDKKNFFKYLRGPESPYKKQPMDFLKSHLLVIGYSASDARCVQMIKFVLDLDRDFRVFWICHSENDKTRVAHIFKDYLGAEAGTSHGIMHLVVTDRSDLLLWELYQAVNLSLPGGGYSIQFSHHVPPQNPNPERRAKVREKVNQLQQEMKDKVVWIDTISGTAAPMTAAFFEFRSRRFETVWYELEDYHDPLDLYFSILSSISIRRGFFQLEWISFFPPDIRTLQGEDLKAQLVERLNLLKEKFRITATEWIFFLYARNGPGGCTGWSQRYWQHDDGQHERMLVLLQSLHEAKFNVIYMPYGKDRHKRNGKKADKIEKVADEVRASFGEAAQMDESRIDYMNWRRTSYFNGKPEDSPSAANPVHITEAVLDNDNALKSAASWMTDMTAIIGERDLTHGAISFEDTIDRVRSEFISTAAQINTTPLRATRMLWLYGLTLFRQARHPAAMVAEAVFPCPNKFNLDKNDNDEERQKWVFDGNKDHADGPEQKGWFNWLADAGLFLCKPGGYAWMYRDTRLGLQYLLEQVGSFELPRTPCKQDGGTVRIQGLWTLRPRIHYMIGDWYLRAFLATGHYIPLIEAMYHSVQALSLARHYVPPLTNSCKPEKENKNFSPDRVRLGWSAICQIYRLAKLGRRSLAFWCPGMEVKESFCGGLEEINKLEKAASELCRSQNAGAGMKARVDRAVEQLKLELEHLNQAVRAEGYSHDDQASPLKNGSLENDSLGDSTAREPVVLNHSLILIDQKNWLKPIDSKLRLLSAKTASPNKIIKAIQNIESTEVAQEVATWRREWQNSWSKGMKTDRDLVALIWVLTELMYRIVRRAKLEKHSDIYTHTNQRWKSVCILGYQAMRLCHLLPPDQLVQECDQKVRILTLYGVALGYLDRYLESHRRFNEAHALVVSGMFLTDGKELARIHIGRAEMLLRKARQEECSQSVSSQSSEEKLEGLLPRVICAVDDAWKALEKAEISLGGVSHSSFWWYRLLSLKLVCYSTLAVLKDKVTEMLKPDKDTQPTGKSAVETARLARRVELTMVKFDNCLPFRRRLHFPTTLLALLRDTLIIGSGDEFRQLRALSYALTAARISDESIFGPSGLIKPLIHGKVAGTSLHETSGDESHQMLALLVHRLMEKKPGPSSSLLEKYRAKVKRSYDEYMTSI